MGINNEICISGMSVERLVRFVRTYNKPNGANQFDTIETTDGTVIDKIETRILQLLNGNLMCDQVIALAFATHVIMQDPFFYKSQLVNDIISKIINKIAEFHHNGIACNFDTDQFKALIKIVIFSPMNAKEICVIVANFIITNTTWENVSTLGGKGLYNLAYILTTSTPDTQNHVNVANMIAEKITTCDFDDDANVYNVYELAVLVEGLCNATRDERHDSAIKVLIKKFKQLDGWMASDDAADISDASDVIRFTEIWHHVKDDEDKKTIIEGVVVTLSSFDASDIENLDDKKKFLLIDILSNATDNIINENITDKTTKRCFARNVACCIGALDLKNMTIDQVLSLTKVFRYVNFNKKYGKILLTSIASVISSVSNIDDDIKNVARKIIIIGGKLGDHLIFMKCSNLITLVKSINYVGDSEDTRVIINNIVVSIYNILYETDKKIENELINKSQDIKRKRYLKELDNDYEKNNVYPQEFIARTPDNYALDKERYKNERLLEKLPKETLDLLKFLSKILHFATHSKELEFVTKTIQKLDINKGNNIVTIYPEASNVSAKTHQLKLNQEQLKLKQDQKHEVEVQTKPKQKQKYEEKIQERGGETQQQFQLKREENQEHVGETQKKLKQS